MRSNRAAAGCPAGFWQVAEFARIRGSLSSRILANSAHGRQDFWPDTQPVSRMLPKDGRLCRGRLRSPAFRKSRASGAADA